MKCIFFQSMVLIYSLVFMNQSIHSSDTLKWSHDSTRSSKFWRKINCDFQSKKRFILLSRYLKTDLFLTGGCFSPIGLYLCTHLLDCLFSSKLGVRDKVLHLENQMFGICSNVPHTRNYETSQTQPLSLISLLSVVIFTLSLTLYPHICF